MCSGQLLPGCDLEDTCTHIPESKDSPSSSSRFVQAQRARLPTVGAEAVLLLNWWGSCLGVVGLAWRCLW